MESLPILIEESIQIAWDYLERSGDLGDQEIASNVLLDSVTSMVRVGERRKLMLSNRAITDYKQFRAERHRTEVVREAQARHLRFIEKSPTPRIQ
jgi:hypothetical protein